MWEWLVWITHNISICKASPAIRGGPPRVGHFSHQWLQANCLNSTQSLSSSFFYFHLILLSSNWIRSFIHRQKNVQFYHSAKTDLSLKPSVASSKLFEFYWSIVFGFCPFITLGSQTCFLVFRKHLRSWIWFHLFKFLSVWFEDGLKLKYLDSHFNNQLQVD